jgi:hypothetical protein
MLSGLAKWTQQMLFQREPIRTPIREASTVKVERSAASNSER